MTDYWYEVELIGPGDQAVALVIGIKWGRGGKERVWFTGREQVEPSSFLEMIREKLHIHTHVIVPEPMVDVIGDAIRGSHVISLELGQVKKIEEAEMAFTFEVYSRAEADTIREAVEQSIPAGAVLKDYETSEVVREEAEGVELYAPVHDYVFKGSGRYVGTVPAIIEMAHRLADMDFVHPEKIRLRYSQ